MWASHSMLLTGRKSTFRSITTQRMLTSTPFDSPRLLFRSIGLLSRSLDRWSVSQSVGPASFHILISSCISSLFCVQISFFLSFPLFRSLDVICRRWVPTTRTCPCSSVIEEAWTLRSINILCPLSLDRNETKRNMLSIEWCRLGSRICVSENGAKQSIFIAEMSEPEWLALSHKFSY